MNTNNDISAWGKVRLYLIAFLAVAFIPALLSTYYILHAKEAKDEPAEDVFEFHAANIYRESYGGHTYILFVRKSKSGYGGLSAVHDPDCECAKSESIQREAEKAAALYNNMGGGNPFANPVKELTFDGFSANKVNNK